MQDTCKKSAIIFGSKLFREYSSSLIDYAKKLLHILDPKTWSKYPKIKKTDMETN